jgi:hypothetical protein
MNQTLEKYIQLFCSYAQDNWAAFLPSAELAINNRDATSTEVSLFFLTYGYHMELFAFETEELRLTDKSPI